VRLLEADYALTLFKENVVPLADATVSLDLTDHFVCCVLESNFIHPVLGRLDPHFPDLFVLWESSDLTASLNA